MRTIAAASDDPPATGSESIMTYATEFYAVAYERLAKAVAARDENSLNRLWDALPPLVRMEDGGTMRPPMVSSLLHFAAEEGNLDTALFLTQRAPHLMRHADAVPGMFG